MKKFIWTDVEVEIGCDTSIFPSLGTAVCRSIYSLASDIDKTLVIHLLFRAMANVMLIL